MAWHHLSFQLRSSPFKPPLVASPGLSRYPPRSTQPQPQGLPANLGTSASAPRLYHPKPPPFSDPGDVSTVARSAPGPATGFVNAQVLSNISKPDKSLWRTTVYTCQMVASFRTTVAAAVSSTPLTPGRQPTVHCQWFLGLPLPCHNRRLPLFFLFWNHFIVRLRPSLFPCSSPTLGRAWPT